jgi:hypothetical protein
MKRLGEMRADSDVRDVVTKCTLPNAWPDISFVLYASQAQLSIRARA